MALALVKHIKREIKRWKESEMKRGCDMQRTKEENTWTSAPVVWGRDFVKGKVQSDCSWETELPVNLVLFILSENDSITFDTMLSHIPSYIQVYAPLHFLSIFFKF